MKLNSPEAKAISFIILMIAVSVFARMLNRRDAAQVSVAPVSAGVLDAAPSPAKPKKQTTRRSAPRPLGGDEKIDPNSATSLDLDRLPGVGPSLAAAIVKDREANGPFLSSSDLARVRGVSPARARSLAKHLSIPAGLDAPISKEQRGDVVIPLNSAIPADLDPIEGVSQKLAARIVAVRDSLRGFRDWS